MLASDTFFQRVTSPARRDCASTEAPAPSASTFPPSRFSATAWLRRHPQLIASENPPVLLWDCSGGAGWKSLERRNLPAEVSLAWKRVSLCAGASLVCHGGFPLSCGPRRPEQTLEICQARGLYCCYIHQYAVLHFHSFPDMTWLGLAFILDECLFKQLGICSKYWWSVEW